MHLSKSERGFEIVKHPSYVDGVPTLALQQSSAIGDYDDSLQRPGSSYLWVGDKLHLNREEAVEMARYIMRWAQTGKLSEDP